jgi:Fe2+ transport system protein FeoA
MSALAPGARESLEWVWPRWSDPRSYEAPFTWLSRRSLGALVKRLKIQRKRRHRLSVLGLRRGTQLRSNFTETTSPPTSSRVPQVCFVK